MSAQPLGVWRRPSPGHLLKGGGDPFLGVGDPICQRSRLAAEPFRRADDPVAVIGGRTEHNVLLMAGPLMPGVPT